MGFAQEMKDFLSAAQTGQKMIGAVSDEDYKKTKKAYLQAQLDTINAKNLDEAGEGGERRARSEEADIALKGANTQAAKARANYYLRYGQPGTATPSDADAAAAAAAPGLNPTPAVPAAPAAPAVPAQVSEIDPAEVAGGIPQEPVQQAAVGGPIKHYAAGGAVADDGADEEDDDDTDDPVRVAAVGPGSAPAPSPAGPGFSPQAAHDAIDAGTAYGQKHFGLDQVAALRTPGQAMGARARAAGAHAAPLEDMTKLKQAVDPQGVMGESTRNLAAIGALYQFKMNKGDTDGAARAAFQMIQHYRVAADKYAAIAAAAGEKGDTDTMVHAAMKAYANIPDGKNFNIAKTPDGQLQYSFTDDHGNVIQKGIEPPDKLAAAAMGMVRGGFDRALNDRAGVPNPKEAAPPKGIKVSDKTALLKGVDAAYETQNPDVPDPNDPKKSNPKYNPDDQAMHKGAAFRMLVHPSNSGLTPDEATQVATKIADPTIPDKGGFSPKKVDGGYEVSFGKRKTFVPEDDFDSLMAKRSELLDAKKTKDKKAEDDAKASGATVKGAIDTASGIWDGLKDWNARANAKAKAEMDARDKAKAAVPATKEENPIDYSSTM